ncbi:MAG: hypothetical protein IIB81_04445 [Nanoarchaeota archaeon]|nr:hypothetical protein [Nanoarchaeota archaeon]
MENRFRVLGVSLLIASMFGLSTCDEESVVEPEVRVDTVYVEVDTVFIETEIEIESFDDPYYLVNTAGSYVNKIRRSGTKFDEWSVEKVNDFIRDGNYTHFGNSDAPSFLMRFTDDTSASSCCGIENLVNPNNPAILDKDVSYVDYLYWSSVENCASPPYTLVRVNEINTEFPDFKFDINHLAKYKLSADEQICPPPE